GFLAENAAFAAACREAGLTFVGPSAKAIEKLGNKSAARRLASEAKVPVVPGSDDASSADEAAQTAGGIGYPIMVKAAAGGGGRGIRVAEDEDELRKAVQVARREAEAAFGDGTLYLEKLLVAPRHVEVQVMGDHEGNVIHLYERECSMQRRRQKVLEEAPSPGISLGVREKMAEAAVRLAREAGYANAGTVEFLVEDEEFYFIEMNTRIQVEHPVTEMLTGVDLVKEQIRIAAGDPLSLAQKDVPMVGHAMEFRINAEDPDQDFMPSPGEISRLEVPGGPGVRVDSAIYQGYQIPPFYDSLVGKLIVWALTREEAISRARRALREYRLEGIKTTIPLHLRLLKGEAFRSGEYHTGYLEELLNGD
ncbi:MAG TPA: ATP-grasp domain-containing protein, partial [Rubrobacter sp.]|nr:ATP-grasp domain-containing protein [Rubrobacter sp.]